MDIDDDRIKDITLREERRFELACLVWLSTAGAWTHSQHESTECVYILEKGAISKQQWMMIRFEDVTLLAETPHRIPSCESGAVQHKCYNSPLSNMQRPLGCNCGQFRHSCISVRKPRYQHQLPDFNIAKG